MTDCQSWATIEIVNSPVAGASYSSIGCPLARLYATYYSGVKGILFLDSMIANSDFVSIFEPHSGVSQEEIVTLAKTRETVGKIFAPNVANAEGFNRLYLKDDVPFSDQPALTGQPWITVST